jgi:uncharacterized damage-inducible protein DinB
MQFIEHHDNRSLAAALAAEACFTLGYSQGRIAHVVEQLSQEDLWWRPYASANAAGNILLHVCGNLRQWIVRGLPAHDDQPREDDRDRPAEFAQREPIPGDVLMQRLRDTVRAAQDVIAAATEADLLRPRRIQGFRVTGIGAVWHSVAHLEGHAQELIYLARTRLGERYRFKDQY